MMDLLFLSVELPLWWVLLGIVGLSFCSLRAVANVRQQMRGAGQ